MEPVTSAHRARGAGASTQDPLSPGHRIAELQRLDAAHPVGRWFLPLGAALREAGRVKDALAVVRQGLSRDPDCLSGWVVLGQCYLALDELASSARVLSSVLRRDRENTVALRGLAIIHARRGEREEAAAHYRALLKLVPRDLAAQEALAALLDPAWEDEAAGDSGAPPIPSGSNGDLRAPREELPRHTVPAGPPARAKRKSRFDPRTREPSPPRPPRGAAAMLPPAAAPRGGIFEAAPHDLDWERAAHDPRAERGASAAREARARRETPAPREAATRRDAAMPREAATRRKASIRRDAPMRSEPPAPERAGALTGYRRWLERMIEESGQRRGTGARDRPKPAPGGEEG